MAEFTNTKYYRLFYKPSYYQPNSIKTPIDFIITTAKLYNISAEFIVTSLCLDPLLPIVIRYTLLFWTIF